VRNIKVVVGYDGSDYSGFQYQPNARTIQGELERVLGLIVKEKVTVYGSGRTDAGVHAEGQVINFRTEGSIPIDKLCIAANSLLPPSIVAVEASEVDADFHARYSAKSRLYVYDIGNRDMPSALESRYCWHVSRPLDVEAMKESAKSLVGIHDFYSFACAGRDDGSPVRELMEMAVERRGEHVIVTMRANAFLRSMARIIVGTLVQVGLGTRPGSDVERILQARDRRLAGKTAPAHGLCLKEVQY